MVSQETKSCKKVFFEITRACNLACRYCLNTSGRTLPVEMETRQVMRALESIAKLQPTEIRFTGGEPLTHPHVITIMAHTTRLGMTVSLGTNATLIDRVMAEQLVRAGLKKAVVSINEHSVTNGRTDGLQTSVLAWNGAKNLKQAGVEVRINSIVTKSSLPGLGNLANACAKEQCKLFLRRYIPSGRGVKTLAELPSRDDYSVLKKRLSTLVRQGVVDGHYLDVGRHDCSAGSSGIVVLPDGRIQSCGFLPALGEKAYGNILTGNLEAIWQRITHSSFLRTNQQLIRSWNQQNLDLPETNCLAMCLAVKTVSKHRQPPEARRRR